LMALYALTCAVRTRAMVFIKLQVYHSLQVCWCNII